MTDDVSTRFPFINLEKALSRAALLFQADKSGKPMLVPTAFEVWGYSPKSSGGFQTVAALKGYGLLEDEGANADRRVRLSDRARRYFLDERDEVRADVLRVFALHPPLFRALWDGGWSAGVPADTVARSHLKLERHLNEQSARAALNIFKENVQFAGLNKASVPPAASLDSEASDGQGKAAPEPEASATMHSHQSAPTPPASAAPPPAAHQFGKPIVFDMESVTVSARFDNVDDLREFIAKLQRLEPLMPPKQ